MSLSLIPYYLGIGVIALKLIILIAIIIPGDQPERALKWLLKGVESISRK